MSEPCCFIPEDQQAAVKSGLPYKSCEKAAEWEIYDEGTASRDNLGTLACTEHVGELLGASANNVFPFEGFNK